MFGKLTHTTPKGSDQTISYQAARQPLTHHSVAPTRQRIEGKGAIFFGDRVAQINQALIWGLEARHWGHVAAQDVLREGRRDGCSMSVFRVLNSQLAEVNAWVPQARGSTQAGEPSFRG